MTSPSGQLRVVAHVHSAWSYDASWSLVRLAAAFRKRGYDAVLMAEHDKGFDQARWDDYRHACAEASSPELLLVPGIEYGDDDNAVHIPVWGNVPFLGSGLETANLLERAAEHGGFSVFAHPGRREAWRRYLPDWLPHLSAVETWNRKYDGWAPSISASRLAERENIDGFVSLDFHTRRQFFPLGMRIEVQGPATVDSVYAGLNAGAFTPLLARVPLEAIPAQLNPVFTAAERLRRQLARAHKASRRPTSRWAGGGRSTPESGAGHDI